MHKPYSTKPNVNLHTKISRLEADVEIDCIEHDII